MIYTSTLTRNQFTITYPLTKKKHCTSYDHDDKPDYFDIMRIKPYLKICKFYSLIIIFNLKSW